MKEHDLRRHGYLYIGQRVWNKSTECRETGRRLRNKGKWHNDNGIVWMVEVHSF